MFTLVIYPVSPISILYPSFCLPYQIMMPRFGLKVDKNFDPSDDWEGDCKGNTNMNYPDFFDAVFELADMWCDSVDAAEYAKLIQVTSHLRKAELYKC